MKNITKLLIGGAVIGLAGLIAKTDGVVNIVIERDAPVRRESRSIADDWYFNHNILHLY